MARSLTPERKVIEQVTVFGFPNKMIIKRCCKIKKLTSKCNKQRTIVLKTEHLLLRKERTR